MDEYFHMDPLPFNRLYDRYFAMRVFHRADGNKVLIKTSSVYVKGIMKQLGVEPINYKEN